MNDMNQKQHMLKNLPAVDLVLDCPKLKTVHAPHCHILEAAREAVAQARQEILAAENAYEPDLDSIRADTLQRLQAKMVPSLRKVDQRLRHPVAHQPRTCSPVPRRT